MHVLFIHQAFPAQFGRLALELTERHGWRCSFLVGSISRCPTPSAAMLERLELQQIPLPPDYRPQEATPWPQSYGRYLELCRAVFEAVRARPDLRPDLVGGPSGLGPTLFLPDLLDCPFVHYCDYYCPPRRRHLCYRIDLPPAEPAPFFPRCINAPTLVTLTAGDAGYAPTHWQRQSFPRRFWPKIEVHFDGVDTE